MSSRSTFVERLSAIAEMVGSVNALAKKAGVSQTGLRNYLLHSEPTRPVIEAIANAAGVSPELRMKLTDSKSAEVHRGYTHLEMDTPKQAMAKLPSLRPQRNLI